MGQFEKGQSGNTATRFQEGNKMQKVKGYEQAKTTIKRILSTPSEENPELSNSEAIIYALTRKAITGDSQAAIFLYDRVHGKPKAEIELSGAAFQHNLRYQNLDELREKMRLADIEIKRIDDENEQ